MPKVSLKTPRPRGSPSSKFHLRKPEVPHKYDTVLGVSTKYKMLPATRITKDVVRQQTNVFHGYYKSWLWENFQEAKVLRYYNLSIHSSTITSLSKHLNTKYDWHLHYWKSLRSLANRIQVHHKGQLSLKCLFGVFNSSKKRTKNSKFGFRKNWRYQKGISKLTDLYLAINLLAFFWIGL